MTNGFIACKTAATSFGGSMSNLKFNLSIVSSSLAVALIAGCGLTAQKSPQNDAKNSGTAQGQSQEGSSQVAQGSFALVQPDLSDSTQPAPSSSPGSAAPSASQLHFDFFEIHLIPDRENAVKDYIKKVAYAPGQVIQIDQIIAGSYTVEVNVYSLGHLALQGKASAQVKSNDSAKVDIDLKYVSDKGDGSLTVVVHGPGAIPVSAPPGNVNPSNPPVPSNPPSPCSNMSMPMCPNALPVGYHFGPATYDQNHCMIRCGALIKD